MKIPTHQTNSKAASLNETILQLQQVMPHSRKEMITAIQRLFADSFVDLVDTHNTKSTIFVFSAGQSKYLLKAEYGARSATAKEVDWYDAIELGKFPAPTCLASFKNEAYAFLLLDYIENAATIDDLATNDTISASELDDFLKGALEANEALFLRSVPVTASPADMDAFFLQKYERRCQEANNHPYLKELLDGNGYTVNGVKLYPPDYYLNRIKNDRDLHTFLTPDQLGLIHGDFHCGNILVASKQVYLVDPNGTLKMPLEYDYGKIFHSIHGAYGSIMREDYKLKRLSRNSYSFDIRSPRIYSEAMRSIKGRMTDQQFLRGLYAEAMHFATLLPHHAEREEETTALFIRCMQVFDELFYYLGKSNRISFSKEGKLYV